MIHNTKGQACQIWEFLNVSTLVVCMLVTQLCVTLCNPMDSSPPGSSAHGIIQARILEWVAIFYSRGSSRPRDRTRVFCNSCIARQILYHWCYPGSLLHQVSRYKLGLSQANGSTMVIGAQRYGWQTSQTLQKVSRRIPFWSFSIFISLANLFLFSFIPASIHV